MLREAIYDCSSFFNIPGAPLAYWASNRVFDCFSHGTIENIEPPRFGMSTSNNDRFVRLWYEVSYAKFARPAHSFDDVEKSKKWFPYNNGGDFRRWYGNNFDVVNWEQDGKEIKDFGRAAIRNAKFYYQTGITWTSISSAKISVRAFGYGFLFSSAGFCIFTDKCREFLLALMNSKVSQLFLTILAPTLNFNVGDIAKIPVIGRVDNEVIAGITEYNISLSKQDWDSFETSWDFKKHPLI